MDFNSIRSKIILLFVPLIILPLLISGIFGAFYFQDTLKHNIQEDSLAQARSLAGYMDTYVPSLVSDLNSLASRPYVVNEMASLNVANNTSVIDETLRYGTVNTDFFSFFVTDTSGKVISSYPDVDETGLQLSNISYVQQVLSTSKSQIIGPLANRTGNPTIYISVPITSINGTLLGVMVGELDPNILGEKILYAQEKNRQYIYVVNSTGFIIVHSNKSYMDKLNDFSSVQSVQSVIHGDEGVNELYDPVEQQYMLSAYSPVKSLGWGIVEAIPTSIAYQPVTNVLMWIAGLTLALIIISLAFAYLFSKSLIDAIMGLFEAAKSITNRREYKQYLPLKRKDEIGQVAVCIDKMAQSLSEDREKLLTAKNDAEMEKDHAEEEKNRSDFYVDVMGHDINNLNQATYGYLELLQADKTLTEEQRRLVDNAINPLLGSSSIIGNVRKVQEITSGKQSLEKLDINSLISQCIKEVHKPSDKKVVINYSPKEGRFVNAIPLLKDVFCNLIDNSIKYSGPEVAIDIIVDESFSEGKKFHVIFISDNGNGIPDSIKQKIFRRLQRGTTKAHGRGLGLFIVKTLVERVGGSVTVEDRVPGDYTKGSKFIVKLPVFEG